MRTITNARWYIRNSNIHADVGVPTIEKKYYLGLLQKTEYIERHPNKLAKKLLDESSFQRLKQKSPLDLLN